MTPRSAEIKAHLLKTVHDLSISETDTQELARILVQIIRETQNLLPINLKYACQGILAINQASFGRKIEGSNLKNPNSLVKSMLRYREVTKECIAALVSTISSTTGIYRQLLP
jgi:hypothetical protein